jgi:hypothetical protein
MLVPVIVLMPALALPPSSQVPGRASPIAAMEDCGPPQSEPAKVLKLGAEPIKDAVTLKQVLSDRFHVKVFLENTGKEPVVIWPYLLLEIRDKLDKRVIDSKIVPRWGLILAPSIIEEMNWATVQPGAKYTFRACVWHYTHDPKHIRGWKLRAGEYTLIFKYRYDRAVVKETYGNACKDLKNPKRPWNQAIEFEQEVVVKLTVEK